MKLLITLLTIFNPHNGIVTTMMIHIQLKKLKMTLKLLTSVKVACKIYPYLKWTIVIHKLQTKMEAVNKKFLKLSNNKIKKPKFVLIIKKINSANLDKNAIIFILMDLII